MSDYVSLAVAGISGAIAIAKNLKDFDSQKNEASYKLQLSDLISTLADAKMGMAELKDSLREKDNEIRSLKEDLKIKENIVYNDPYYQIKTDENKMEGEYCKVCYDDLGKLIRLEQLSEFSWVCGKCKNQCYRD